MRVIRLMNELRGRRCWCGIFRLISFVSVFPIYFHHSSSHNVGTQTTSAELVLFNVDIDGGGFFSFSLSLDFFLSWFEKAEIHREWSKRVREIEPNGKSRVHILATLITIKCFVFFRPFQLYKQKRSEKFTIHSLSLSLSRPKQPNKICQANVMWCQQQYEYVNECVQKFKYIH